MWAVFSLLTGIILGIAIMVMYNEWVAYYRRRTRELAEEEYLKNFLKEYHYGVASRSRKRINFIVGEENDYEED